MKNLLSIFTSSAFWTVVVGVIVANILWNTVVKGAVSKVLPSAAM